jgi:hypothetical protein
VLSGLLFLCLVVSLYWGWAVKRRGSQIVQTTPSRAPEEPPPVFKLPVAEKPRPNTPLDIVGAAKFTVRKLMNKSEYRVFRIAEEILKECSSGNRVMAQVSLGEILSCDSDVYWTINSKRVDVLVIDPWGMPVLAVEMQGGGHFQGNAPMRDAVKKEALRKAGVKWLEILEDDDDAAIRTKLQLALGLPVKAAISPSQS